MEKKHKPNKNSSTYAKKWLSAEFADDENYCNVCDHYYYTGSYRGGAHSICNLRWKTLKKGYCGIHSKSNYDFHSIIKELVEKFEG